MTDADPVPAAPDPAPAPGRKLELVRRFSVEGARVDVCLPGSEAPAYVVLRPYRWTEGLVCAAAVLVVVGGGIASASLALRKHLDGSGWAVAGLAMAILLSICGGWLVGILLTPKRPLVIHAGNGGVDGDPVLYLHKEGVAFLEASYRAAAPDGAEQARLRKRMLSLWAPRPWRVLSPEGTEQFTVRGGGVASWYLPVALLACLCLCFWLSPLVLWLVFNSGGLYTRYEMRGADGRVRGRYRRVPLFTRRATLELEGGILGVDDPRLLAAILLMIDPTGAR